MAEEQAAEVQTAASDEAMDDVKWEDISSANPGEDDSEGGAAPAATVVEEKEETPTPAAKEEGEETLPAKETKPTEEAKPAVTDPAPQTPAVAAPKEETPEERTKREEDYRKWLDGERGRLTEVYKLSEDDAEKLQTEPELVLPRILAEMHLNMQRTMLENMQNVLPQVLGQSAVAQAREAEAKSVFYKEWPELAEHHTKVLEVGKMYRQMNPKATPEEAIEAIGLMTKQILKIKTPKASEVPAARAKPHTPANPGSSGGGTPKTAVKSDNQFADLLDD